jgi:hypothetical protein
MKRGIAAVAALMLVSCGGHGAGNNQQAAANGSAGTTGTAAAPGAGLLLQPGAWESVVQMDMPNMPPEARARMANQTHRTCMTPEALRDANAIFLGGGMSRNGVNCNTSGMTVGGGRINGTVICQAQGTETRMTLNGTFTQTSYDMNQHISANTAGHPTDITAHIVAHRVGDCTAAETSEANAMRAPR